jgi:hypothetical protein
VARGAEDAPRSSARRLRLSLTSSKPDTRIAPIPCQVLPLSQHIDDLQTRVKEALIPIALLQTDDRVKVAIVFERINHQGVPLDTLQLLTAWESLEEHGFAGVGEDTSLVLRCCAAILVGEPTADRLIGLNGAAVRDRFDDVENGIKGAIDFLRTQLGVETLRNMPYPTMLIPPEPVG